MNRANPTPRLLIWLLLLLTAIAALGLVLTPAWLIQPFRPQTARDLAISYTLRHNSPIATLALALLAIALTIWLWRNTKRWWTKLPLIALLLLTFVSAWFARQNHFEWMFNPLKNSSYATASDAAFMQPDDMVMAVDNDGESVAYPIREMAYHHVVQDVVGRKPIVATY
jgi:hypothetical protein